jgi:hypothetical protein
VSADAVVPSAGKPQSLNRYAYVFNNPLKYTDPSGHCAYEDKKSGDRDECYKIMERLKQDYELVFAFGSWSWTKAQMEELESTFKAIRDKVGGAGVFKQIWSGTTINRYSRDPHPGECSSDACANPRNGDINLYQGQFTKGYILENTMLHEMGHVWDIRRSWRLSEEMKWYTGSEERHACGGQGCIKYYHLGGSALPEVGEYNGAPIRSYPINGGQKEDFAMAFQLWVNANDIATRRQTYTPAQYDVRVGFLNEQVGKEFLRGLRR